MPTSHPHQLNEIMEAVLVAKPSKVLDIGIGFGKYGMLCREYLEYWTREKNYHKREVIIDGIEIFENYRTPLWMVYDNIFIGDCLDVLKLRGKKEYAIILLVDVIEHLEKEKGKKLLAECERVSFNTLVSTPKAFNPQKPHFNNINEKHISLWKYKDFKHLKNNFFIKNSQSIISFSGTDPTWIKPLLRSNTFE